MRNPAVVLGFCLVAALFSPGCAETSPHSPMAVSAPQDYYATVDPSTRDNLRRTLHELIDDHKRFPYSSTATDTWDVLEEADQDPGNPNNILDLYRNTSIPKQGGGNTFYNREHSWPKSYGFPDDEASNHPYTDCHMLFLSNSGYNSSRSNKPYGTVTGSASEKPTEENSGQGGGNGAYPGNSNWTENVTELGSWETWRGRRGDVARALLYMDVRYEGGQHQNGSAEPDLILTNDLSLIRASHTGNNEPRAYMGYLSVLLEWHAQDPVDDKERRRNGVVQRHQGNRNPFIDHPEWVGYLYAGTPLPASGSRIWINEVHYDNDGVDQNEFVEIAGPAGTNLTNWTLVAYNGANGRFYKIIRLQGVIPNQSNGVGTLAFDFPDLQNGAPDGLALVNAENQVVEFLSYEGSFSATEGAAQGMTSADIQVVEPPDSAVGHSLQRSGSGPTSTGQTWQAPRPNTRGQPNSGQSF